MLNSMCEIRLCEANLALVKGYSAHHARRIQLQQYLMQTQQPHDTTCDDDTQADREAHAAAAEERRATVAVASRKLFLRSTAVQGLQHAAQLSDALAERQVPCDLCAVNVVMTVLPRRKQWRLAIATH